MIMVGNQDMQHFNEYFSAGSFSLAMPVMPAGVRCRSAHLPHKQGGILGINAMPQGSLWYLFPESWYTLRSSRKSVPGDHRSRETELTEPNRREHLIMKGSVCIRLGNRNHATEADLTAQLVKEHWHQSINKDDSSTHATMQPTPKLRATRCPGCALRRDTPESSGPFMRGLSDRRQCYHHGRSPIGK